MIKYYAYQMDPELQRDDLFWDTKTGELTVNNDEIADYIVITGHSRMRSYFNDLYDQIDHYHDEVDVDDRNELVKALTKLSGEEWNYTEIRGYYQGEWQVLYYNVNKINDETIKYIEACYFNTGIEFDIYDRKKEDGEEGEYFHIYLADSCFSSLRAEMAGYLGCEENELEIYEFDGYYKTPKYKKVD